MSPERRELQSKVEKVALAIFSKALLVGSIYTIWWVSTNFSGYEINRRPLLGALCGAMSLIAFFSAIAIMALYHKQLKAIFMALLNIIGWIIEVPERIWEWIWEDDVPENLPDTKPANTKRRKDVIPYQYKR